MNIDFPVWIIEPETAEKKRELVALKLLSAGQEVKIPELISSIGEVKCQLKKMREESTSKISQLIEELMSNLKQRYPQIKVKSASDHTEVIDYIKEISDGIKTISINNSSVVTQELKPDLITSGFTVINSYLNEFDVKEKKIIDYWDLPRFLDKNLSGTFDVSIKMTGIGQTLSVDRKYKKYMAVLGANAISAEDTTVFFLEHFSNIYKDIAQAEKVVVIVGLDKIVQRREDAAFQSKCMGIFGMESVLLGIKPKTTEAPSIAELQLPVSDHEREVYLIILDNGRSKLLESKYKQLFLCIGCRACNLHCPIRYSFYDVDYIWTPRNYLNQFLFGTSHSIDICLHCEACRIECPLDIDLPGLMWEAKTEYIAKHGRSFYHKILGMPEMLAKLGTTFAPLANRFMQMKLVRILMESIVGIDRRTNLPKFNSVTFMEWYKKHGG
jgi:L-lactate utilization protein LutB